MTPDLSHTCVWIPTLLRAGQPRVLSTIMVPKVYFLVWWAMLFQFDESVFCLSICSLDMRWFLSRVFAPFPQHEE